jgi:hypothetical protein
LPVATVVTVLRAVNLAPPTMAVADWEFGANRLDLMNGRQHASKRAVFLDMYRVEFQEGRQSKAEVLFRLQIQRDRLVQHSARQTGVKFLDSLIQTVEGVQLQSAAPRGGRQLQLRDDSLRTG